MKILPNELRRRRVLAGHTTRSLGEHSGVSQQRISDLERMDRPVIRPTTGRALARALNCDLSDIVDLEDELVGP